MDASLVSRILARLLVTGAAAPSLDTVAEAIGAAPVTMQDIEAIFDGLEAAGRSVDAEPRDPPAALKQVLATVRSFSAVSGRRPTVPEIAEHSGLSVAEVRFAMLYARVLVR
ncbi:MAG: sigma-70 domain-containing protein [Pseudomonadota bacterium]